MNRIYQGKVAIIEIPADFIKIKKGLKLSLAPVQELRLIASLLSSRQFGILTTAGFDLDTMKTPFNSSVNYGLQT